MSASNRRRHFVNLVQLGPVGPYNGEHEAYWRTVIQSIIIKRFHPITTQPNPSEVFAFEDGPHVIIPEGLVSRWSGLTHASRNPGIHWLRATALCARWGDFELVAVSSGNALVLGDSQITCWFNDNKKRPVIISAPWCSTNIDQLIKIASAPGDSGTESKGPWTIGSSQIRLMHAAGPFGPDVDRLISIDRGTYTVVKHVHRQRDSGEFYSYQLLREQ